MRIPAGRSLARWTTPLHLSPRSVCTWAGDKEGAGATRGAQAGREGGRGVRPNASRDLQRDNCAGKTKGIHCVRSLLRQATEALGGGRLDSREAATASPPPLLARLQSPGRKD